MDHEQTYQAYKNLGMGKKFEQHPDFNTYKKQQAWYEKVKSPRTGEYNQAEELIKRELVPEGWQPPRIVKGSNKPVTYPIKQVSEIIRKRLADDSEWLISRQQWIGLDQLGNELVISMNDKEKFDELSPVYTLKPENPKDDPRFRDTRMVRVIDRVESRIKYTEPFSPETAQKLYDMRNGKCSLCVIDESGGPGDYPPVSVPSFEHFKMPFDELWEMVTTPKYKIDRSYGDTIEQAHIK